MTQIFDLIGIPLGFVMSLIYDVFNNYLITIFLFTFFIRLVLFPIYLKQQKSAMDRARLAPRLERLQKKYANDRQKLATKQQELYERHGVSMTGGCMPMLLSMLVLFGVISVIYSPLTQLNIVPEQVSIVAQQAVVEEGKVEAKDMEGYYGELRMMQYAVECKDAIIDKINEPSVADLNKAFNLDGTKNKITKKQKEDYLLVQSGEKTDKELGYTKEEPNMYAAYIKKYNDIMKEDMGDSKQDPGTYYYNAVIEMGKDFRFGDRSLLQQPWREGGFKQIDILWLIPLISGLTAFLVSFISTQYNKRSMPQNQAGQGCMTFSMMIYMPAVSLFIAFTVPGAVGIYWIVSNLFSMLQTVILNKIYDPAKARAEAEQEYQERRRKKAEDKKRLAMSRQREEAEARKAEQALERQREESREMNKKKKKKGTSGAANKPAEKEENGTTDAVDTQPVDNTDDASAE